MVSCEDALLRVQGAKSVGSPAGWRGRGRKRANRSFLWHSQHAVCRPHVGVARPSAPASWVRSTAGPRAAANRTHARTGPECRHARGAFGRGFGSGHDSARRVRPLCSACAGCGPGRRCGPRAGDVLTRALLGHESEHMPVRTKDHLATLLKTLLDALGRKMRLESETGGQAAPAA